MLTADGIVTLPVSTAVNICKGAPGQDQVATANQPQQLKAGSKKKQRGGKKAAKGGKGNRTASGSMAQAVDADEEATVEFFVPADEGGTDFELRGQYLLSYLPASLLQFLRVSINWVVMNWVCCFIVMVAVTMMIQVDASMHTSAHDSYTMLFAYAWTVQEVCGGLGDTPA